MGNSKIVGMPLDNGSKIKVTERKKKCIENMVSVDHKCRQE